MNNYDKYIGKVSNMSIEEMRIFLDGHNIDTLDELFTWFDSYVEPLTNDEKKYLKNVIEPFKDRVQYIYKAPVDYLKTTYAICIVAKYPTSENVFSIMLEPFPITSNKYIGMVKNHDYMLEELGLDE